MNSIWNKNISQFKNRFPSLYENLKEKLHEIQEPEKETEPFIIEKARNSQLTARIGTIPLHSKYNPQREAVQAADSFEKETYSAAAFLSFGLGWLPVEFCKAHPEVPVILIEPDVSFLNLALNSMDFTPVLTHNQAIIFCAADLSLVINYLRQFSDKTLKTYSLQSQTQHCRQYQEEILQSLRHNRQKDEINSNTLEKFAGLWLHNSCRNLQWIEKLQGVNKYANLAAGKGLPFLILAAGPSLEKVLPYLKELSRRCITVCVDTSLHACLKAGIQPDFIVLVDPQYACAMHMEFLSSPQSVLITESAVWPSIFRFNCREKVLCSSMFPMGQYFESFTGPKGKLAAGGSVTTTAWDFARICGASDIIIAGMDLGFPGKETHVRGSQFEERSHRLSTRFSTAEKDSISSLMGANPKVLKDYLGNDLLTDSRMTLFSWWFENNVQKSNEENQKTWTLTPESLAIKGIEIKELKTLLESPDITDRKRQFFENAELQGKSISESWKKSHSGTVSFTSALNSFISAMEYLEKLSGKAVNLCEKAIADRTKAPEISAKLSLIDSQIMESEAKSAASLIFPTQRQLDEKAVSLPEDSQLHSIYYSRLIYRELQKSAREYLKELSVLPFTGQN